MTPYHESDGVTLYHGDCLQVLRTLPAESIDAVVSDPPYGLIMTQEGFDSYVRLTRDHWPNYKIVRKFWGINEEGESNDQ